MTDFDCRNGRIDESLPYGIGGWLLIPAIGVVISPLLVAVAIAMNVSMFDSPLIAELEVDHPGLRTTILLETLLSAAFLAFQVYVAVVFFMKKRFVPKLMIAYLTINLALTVIAVALTGLVLEEFNASDTQSITRAVVLAAVWIPYFLVSRRVKNTFN